MLESRLDKTPSVEEALRRIARSGAPTQTPPSRADFGAEAERVRSQEPTPDEYIAALRAADGRRMTVSRRLPQARPPVLSASGPDLEAVGVERDAILAAAHREARLLVAEAQARRQAILARAQAQAQAVISRAETLALTALSRAEPSAPPEEPEAQADSRAVRRKRKQR